MAAILCSSISPNTSAQFYLNLSLYLETKSDRKHVLRQILNPLVFVSEVFEVGLLEFSLVPQAHPRGFDHSVD